MKVFGYARVSTADQATDGNSLDAQKRAIEGYAMIHGWHVAELFVEGGVSGSVPLAERPQGQRLLGAVGPGDAIVTPKLDRMFRNAADALTTLEELKAGRVGLHMLDLGGDVTGNGISKLVFTILSAVSENERDRIRERIRDVKRHLAAQGIYNGGKRPFGHDVIDGRLVPNAAEQKIIRRMQRLRTRGDSFHKIGAAVGMDQKTVKRILDRVARSQAA